MRDLNANASTSAYFVSQASTWSSATLTNNVNTYSVCGGVYIMGGYGVLSGSNTYGEYFSKTFYNLQPHEMIYFSFNLFEIDSLDKNDFMQIRFDSRSFSSTWNMSSGNYNTSINYCGNPVSGVSGKNYSDLVDVYIFGRAAHSGTTLTVQFVTMNANGTSSDESYGFRDLYLLFANTSSPIATTQDMCAYSPSQVFSRGNCSCSTGYYYSYDSSSCSPCDELCTACFGASASMCYRCISGAGWNGTACVRCHSSCAECSGSSAGQCSACHSSEILYKGAYCISSANCLPPLVATSDIQGNNYCDSDCSISQFLYWNGTCASTCASPLKQIIIEDVINNCIYPCAAGQVLNWNGLCMDVCASPKVERIQASLAYCDPPCPDFNYYYVNSTMCVSLCPAPMISNTVDDIPVCANICNDQAPYFSVEQQTCVSVCISPYKLVSYGFYTACLFNVSSQDNATAQALASITNTLATVSTAAAIVTGVLSVSDPSGAIVATLAKMLQFMKFVNVSHTARVELMLQKTKITTRFLYFSAKMPDGWQSEFDSHTLPSVFSKRNVSAGFIVSFWDGLTSLQIVLAMYLIFLLLASITRFRNDTLLKCHLFFSKVNSFIQNFLLAQFYGCFVTITLFAVLQFSVPNAATPLSHFSYSVAITFTAFMCIALIMHILLLFRYQSVREESNRSTDSGDPISQFTKDQEGVHVLFFDFKDASFISQCVFLLLALRSIVFSLIITLLYLYPFLQMMLITVLSVLMICYLLIVRPFKRLINMVQQLVLEGVLITVSACFLGISVIDTNKLPHEDTWQNLNSGIIICNMMILVVGPAFAVVKLILLAVTYWRNKREQNLQTRRVTEEQAQKISLNKSRSSSSMIVLDRTNLHNASSNLVHGDSSNISFNKPLNISASTNKPLNLKPVNRATDVNRGFLHISVAAKEDRVCPANSMDEIIKSNICDEMSGTMKRKVDITVNKVANKAEPATNPEIQLHGNSLIKDETYLKASPELVHELPKGRRRCGVLMIDSYEDK